MRRFMSIWLLLGVTAACLPLAAFGQDKTEKNDEKVPEKNDEKAADSVAPQPKKDENTPEGALKKFLYSITAHDEEGLKSVAVPDEELEILLAGDKPTPAQLVQMQIAMAISPMKRLKLGDELKLPGGRTLVIDETRVNKNRQCINAMGSPIPYDVQLIEGKWKVNPKPIIAARKAAKKVQERNKQREATEKDGSK